MCVIDAPGDRTNPQMFAPHLGNLFFVHFLLPEANYNMWPAGRLTEDELCALRKRAGCQTSEYPLPLEAVVFDV